MRSLHKLGQLTASQVLRAEGLVTAEQVIEIDEEIQATNERFTEAVLGRSLATEFDIAKAMVLHMQLPMLNPACYPMDESVKTVLPPSVVHNLRVLPYDRFGSLLLVATTGDLDASDIAEIESQSACRATFVIAIRSDLERAIEKDFPAESLGQEVASRLDEIFGS
jgi:hypothetical protein